MCTWCWEGVVQCVAPSGHPEAGRWRVFQAQQALLLRLELCCQPSPFKLRHPVILGFLIFGEWGCSEDEVRMPAEL